MALSGFDPGSASQWPGLQDSMPLGSIQPEFHPSQMWPQSKSCLRACNPLALDIIIIAAAFPPRRRSKEMPHHIMPKLSQSVEHVEHARIALTPIGDQAPAKSV